MYPTHDQSLALEWKSDNGRTVAFWWILSVPRVFFKQAPFTFSSAFPAELSRFYEHLNGKQPPGQPFSHEQTVWSLLDYIYIHIYIYVCVWAAGSHIPNLQIMSNQRHRTGSIWSGEEKRATYTDTACRNSPAKSLCRDLCNEILCMILYSPDYC